MLGSRQPPGNHSRLPAEEVACWSGRVPEPVLERSSRVIYSRQLNKTGSENQESPVGVRGSRRVVETTESNFTVKE